MEARVGKILFEAAQAWRQAGDDDRAIALLTQAVALGGAEGDNARAELAEVLFDLGRAVPGPPGRVAGPAAVLASSDRAIGSPSRHPDLDFLAAGSKTRHSFVH
ncbi:hypothetical protein ACFPN7_38220 [Amycolatopsis halotolerans]|uniref:hypothetical protein n=1 Tax=Amycolatopsis halotolerans TaxID=330083 RepID=UPI00360D6F66